MNYTSSQDAHIQRVAPIMNDTTINISHLVNITHSYITTQVNDVKLGD